MLKSITIIFGVIFILAGLLGFVPSATEHGLLFGLFHVNAAHNIIHLATGAIAVLCGISSYSASKLFFQVFGVIYGIVAILGFVYIDEPILGIIANNIADAWLHVGIAIISLYLGFFYHES